MQASFQPLSLNKFIPAAVWFLVTQVLLFMPSPDLPEMDSWITRLYPDKWVHVFLFGLLEYLINRPFGRADFPVSKKKYTFVVTGVAVSTWGLVTEFIQKNFVPGRDFEMADWGADILGVILAVILSNRLFLRKTN